MAVCDATTLKLSSGRLISLISSPALFIDPDAKIAEVNSAMYAFLNRDEGQLLGCRVFGLVAPGDRQKVQDFISSFLLDNQTSSSADVLSLAIDPLSKLATLTPLFDKNDGVLGFLLQVDGSVLVTENRLWQSAVSTGRLGVWERDFRLDWSTRSPSWWHLRGFESDELPDLTREEWLGRVHQDDLHYFQEFPRLRDTVDGDFNEFRYRERNRQGNWIWILTRGRILRWDDEGRPLYVVGVDANITEAVAAEQHRAELAERLSHGERLKSIGQLTGGIAHDFNNLLAVISGNAELLEDAFDGGDSRLNGILSAVKRGSDFTSSLLAFSRKQPLHPKAIDVADILSQVCLMLRRTIKEHIALDVASKDDIWSCMADQGQLQNAMINLALNARDAMETGGTLSISAENVVLSAEATSLHADVQPGEYVMFTVADDGIGMSKLTLERAFEPFFTTKTVGQGTGLGLSMVFGFAKQSNGHVDIESEQGAGSTIRLYLPRTDAVQTRAGTTLKPAPRNRTKTRILVVEDDDALRTMCIRFLQESGYQVRSFQTADAAFESFLKDDGVDLLLSDLVLPGELDGAQLGVEMRLKKPGLKMLFMSGYNDQQEFGGKLHALGEGYLQKPFTLPELARTIEAILATGDAIAIAASFEGAE